jgi:glycogen debranching enzyme
MPTNTVLDILPGSRKAFAFPPLALKSVTAPDNSNVYASSDELYKSAEFGRDSLEVAEDLLPFKPRLVRNILLRNAALQGSVTNTANEEEPGKIIHEYRSARPSGKKLDPSSQEILSQLSRKWGGTDDELAYYGSVDATPLFLRLLGRYCRLYGNAILQDSVTRRDGAVLSMQDIAMQALAWLEQKLESSSGMVEFQKVNPDGISNQVWKDSEEFYVHANGTNANHDAPIASIEVQGLAFDALQTASKIFPEKRQVLRVKAERLRDTVIDKLWLHDKDYFALGTDYDDSGKLRIITTKTANPAALLDSAIFKGLPENEQQKYVGAIIAHIFSADFLTNAGIRSRALSAGNVVPFWDYHGSYVTWPKETYDIAKGLRRQGMPNLAKQLENRLINIVLKALEYPEFVYVDEWGQALVGKPAKHAHGDVVVLEAGDTPERTQAWTVSAIYAIMLGRLREKVSLKKKHVAPQDWQTALERKIMTRIPKVNRYINPMQLRARYPTKKYALNRTRS